MKKQLLSLILTAGAVLTATGQTIVPTTAQNKKIILEEFTGIHCTFCPDGHVRANAIVAANPGNAFVINVHTGSYATPSAGEPDFRTAFGTAIAGQTDLTGYPSGTVNRTVFAAPLPMTPGGTAMGRDKWLNASNQTKIIPSYVNLAAEATIDVNTRLLTVHVETFYTADSPVATNKLNVALLQNNTTGPQTGGGQGNNYNHQHRLVRLLTSQWGDDITTTTMGTFVDRTYTYSIPANFNSVPAVMGDFEIVAFIAEGQQKIISGNGAIPTYTGLIANDAKIFDVSSIADQCSAVSPKMTLQNNGQTTLTSLPISYNVNGGANQVYNWTGSLPALSRVVVNLPAISYPVLTANTLNIILPADGNTTNNNSSVTFNKSIVSTNSLTLNLQPDAYGSEISWDLKNLAGQIISSGGPYANNDTALISVPITLPADDCYSLNLYDSYGDGIGTGSSYSTLIDSNNLTVFSTNGLYGSGISKNFATGGFLGTDSFEKNSVSLYPNPSNGLVQIKTETAVDVIVTDILGKIVYSANQVNNDALINLSSLQKGIYFARINDGNKQQVERIILN